MSAQNQISVEIPQTVIDSVMKSAKDSQEALKPYLQALTNDQKSSLFKMGDKTLATVQKLLSYTTTNPEFVPGYMEVEEFHKDAKVVEQLSPLLALFEQLVSDLNDTVMLAGSEALTNGMLYYGSVNEAASKGVPAAKPIYDDLSQRFKRGSYKKKAQ